MKIQDFGLLVGKTDKMNKMNIETMSEEQRELFSSEILSASNIACTLVYSTGDTLLRPSLDKNSARPVSMFVL